MHKLVVLCVVAVCRAGVLPAPAVETDLELTAADADAGNWTADLGDMQINIEHKHGGEVQNASGTWTLDLSRTSFQKKENSDIEYSQEAKEETEIQNSKSPAQKLEESENNNQEDKIDNNEMDNEIPHDEEKVDKETPPNISTQLLLLPDKLRQQVLAQDFNIRVPQIYSGPPSFLYEMLPPREENIPGAEETIPETEETIPETEETIPETEETIPETEEPATEEPFSATWEPEIWIGTIDPNPFEMFPDYQTDLVIPENPDLVEKSDDTIRYPDEGALDPDGFEHFRGVGWFKLDDRHMTWGEARDACAEVGAHLAVPDSQERVKAFLKLFQQHPDVPAEAILRDQVYVGVNDPDNNRQFTTVQGKPFNPGFPIWFVNEPDNAAPGESCVTFHVQGRTRDVPCSFSLPFFCEKDVPVVI